MEVREMVARSFLSDGLDDADQLFDAVNQFFEDPDASRKLVCLVRESEAAADVTTSSAATTGTAHALLVGGASTSDVAARIQSSDVGGNTKVVEKATKSQSPKKEPRQRKKKTAKSTKNLRRSKTVAPSPDDTGESDQADANLQTKLIRIQNATDQDLDELDDFSSAWDDAQKTGRAWGGRGFGGRGVNRGLATYRGKDAVVNGLTLTFSGKELLRETHLAINHGHRYGLWGKNGVGKSTLLRRIAGGRVPGWPLHLTVSMVEQEVLGSDKTVRECMLQVERVGNGNVEGGKKLMEEELVELEQKLSKLAEDNDAEALEEISERMSELYEQLEEIERKGASSEDDFIDDDQTKKVFSGLDGSAVAVLKGLQFEDTMLDTPVSNLSGGWRMRVALAEALYSKPDVLLLDEPTNHLDVSAQVFLEEYILKHELTVVIVSHDAHFLDAVCTDMIKFASQKLEYHAGNYSTFKQREEELWTANTRIADATLRKEKKAQEFINKQRSMANSARRDDNKQRQAKEREKKMGRIGLYNADGKKFKLLSERRGTNTASHIQGKYTNSAGFQSFHVDNSQKEFGEQLQLLNFRFPSAVPLKGATGEYAPLITMDECRFRYNNTNSWLLRDMTLNVSTGSRIALLGKNGSGKSTLVKLLCGELQPETSVGAFHRHANLKVAHISQHHVEYLAAHLERSAVEYFLTQHNAKNEHEARQFLGGFGLVGQLALQPIGTLSGGQKARLTFATVMYKAPHVLVLDEPTNHLDGDSLLSLEQAIENFRGAVVVVSHNQDFLARISREVWTICGGKVKVEALGNPNRAEESTLANFNNLYARYKEDLRKEAKQAQKQYKCLLSGTRQCP